MKPIILCGECRTEVRWGDEHCGNCGRPIEWPAEETSSEEVSADAGQVSRRAEKRSARKERSRQEGRKTETSTPLFSWKVIGGFVGFLIVGVLALEVLTGPKQVPTQTSPAAPSQGANMQALGQIGELEQQLASNPNDHRLILQLANLCYDNRFFDKAIQNYRKYLASHPEDPDARVDMGTSYFETGNLDEARRQMETALRHSPKHVQAHYNLGIINLSAGRLQEANEWFKKTIALAPNSDIGRRAQQILEQHSNPQILQNQ